MGYVRGMKCLDSGKIGRDEVTVICITGNGLKTQGALYNKTTSPYYIKPAKASFEETLEKIERR